MQQTKLIQILRCFSSKEIKSFDSFLQSPYFNKNAQLLQFYRLLSPHHPLMDSGRLDKERIFAKLFVGAPYNDKTMRDFTSELFKLCKSFIVQEELRSDPLQASALRFRWLHRHELKKMIVPELEARSLQLEGYGERDRDYYHHSWLHALHQFEMATDQSQHMEHKLVKDYDMLSLVHSLNKFYLAHSLHQLIYLQAIAGVYRFSLDSAFLQQIEALSQPYIDRGDDMLDILYRVFRLNRTEDEKHFYELKERYLSGDRIVPEQILFTAGVALENFTAKKLREGKAEFSAEVMEIYRHQEDRGIHLRNGQMGYIHYFNVVTRGMEAGDLAWLDLFVENNKPRLPEDYREDAYRYAKAHVLFARGQYTEALRLSLSCHITFFIAKVLIRMLVIRTQYELQMTDELRTGLDTLRYHIKDEKLTEDRRQYLMSFVSTMHLLLDARYYYTPEKWEALNNSLTANPGPPNKIWFERKSKDLLEGRQGL